MMSVNMKELIIDLDALGITTPIDIDEDKDYYKTLCETYEKIISIFEVHNAGILVETIEKIKRAIHAYYSGDLMAAQSYIAEIVTPLTKKKYICSSVNKNPAFKRFTAFRLDSKFEYFANKTVDLFRARTSKENVTWKEEDMLHIPFDKRELANSGRFSIPGLPCLYLGKSVYVCWAEMNKPTDAEFYVSLVNLEDDIKIFNLATNIHLISGYAQSDGLDWDEYDFTEEEFLRDHLILWLLSIATSYKVKQTCRNFKSNYIISQLLMLCLRKNNIDGVAYFSKIIPEETVYTEYGQLSVNLAIMANFEEPWSKTHIGHSAICDKLNISKPINFSEFKQIYCPACRSQVKSDNTDESQFHKHISLGGNTIKYIYTQFGRFENHLKCLISHIN